MLEQLTEDHTVAQQKYANGQLTEEELATHASAHVLTRAVGARETLQVDLGYSPVQPGDRYLLCSDGLYNPVEHADICSALGERGEPESTCQTLVELALAGGGPDNITAIVVDAHPPD